MKKVSLEQSNPAAADMPPEYDLSKMKMVRGKYYKALQNGYTRRIRHADGSITEEFIRPHQPSVRLDPDVRKYFPTAEAVNDALRALIKVAEQIPQKEKRQAKRHVKKAA